jgi:ferric-dicitrate binding protein FerR (iron transport regulator)
MTMNCNEAEPKLNEFLDGELADAETQAVDAHLATCPECARALETLRAQDRELDAAFAPLRDEAEALAGRIIAAVHQEPVQIPVPRRTIAWSPILTAAAAGFLVAALLYRSSPPDPALAEALQRCATIEKQLEEERNSAALPPLPLLKKPMATLAVATGAVEVKTDGDWQPLPLGGGVERGTSVRTVGPAKCALDWLDGSEVRLNADTEIHLETHRKLQLRRGQIFCRTTPNVSRLEVAIEQTKVEALGTTIDVSHTTVTVFDETARLGDQTVPAGYACPIVDGRVEPPRPAPELTYETRWVHDLLVLRKGPLPELDRRVSDLLASHEPDLRVLGPACGPPLVRFVVAPDSRRDTGRRRKAARVLADVAGAPVVPDLVALLRDDDPQVRTQMARGLERLTGQTLGIEPGHWTGFGCVEKGGGAEAWNAWLKQNEATWGPPRPPRPPALK